LIDTNDALDKIEEIHNQLSKFGLYKGYKSIVVAISGLIGICGASIQRFFVKEIDGIDFVIFWCIIAGINLVLCTLMILYQYFFKESDFERKKTLAVMVQFIPMIIGGIIVTPFFALNGSSSILLLPGLWALLFGIGILNVRPYLSGLTFIASAFYFLGAIILFYLRFYFMDLLSIGMGLTFGIGQIISAFVLYWSMERNSYERK
jgi:hypothetical protein